MNDVAEVWRQFEDQAIAGDGKDLEGIHPRLYIFCSRKSKVIREEMPVRCGCSGSAGQPRLLDRTRTVASLTP